MKLFYNCELYFNEITYVSNLFIKMFVLEKYKKRPNLENLKLHKGYKFE